MSNAAPTHRLSASHAAGSQPVVEVRGLQMRYGDNEVLTGVDLDVGRGEVVVLLGPNGAGKTTTIEVLEGFRRPSAGTVEVLGADPLHADEAWRARVGIVLQSWRDHARWTPRALVDHLGAYYLPFCTTERIRPVPTDDVLDLVGLGSAADQRIITLSGGQRRRLDVAIGIVGRPELLFLDEPTAGFDPQARREFHDLIHNLTDLEGTTVLLTTHDLAEAEKLADRILILAGGRIVADGSADGLAGQIRARSEVRWTHNEQRFVHAATDATEFVRQLLTEHPSGIDDLEVRRATLEDTYLELVRAHLDPATTPSSNQLITEVAS
jgi:ABC-2 type transport system ATP-binding protein